MVAKAKDKKEESKQELRPRTPLDNLSLRRTRLPPEEPPEPASVSAGPVDRVIELAFNPTRDKIREVTIIDRIQGRLFPQLDMVNYMRHYCLEISMYREDSIAYKEHFSREKPVPPEPLDELLFRIAQWQKSVAGKNLERATDIALAETEAKGMEEEGGTGGVDAWKE